MEVDKRSFVEWLKEHKTELIIAGISVAAVVAAIIRIKNRQVLEEIWESLKGMVEKTSDSAIGNDKFPTAEVELTQNTVEISIVAPERIPHDVVQHLRNLPKGCKASATKVATAVAHGFELLPGQTWVEAYRTGGVAA